jgi:hypothetical protein
MKTVKELTGKGRVRVRRYCTVRFHDGNLEEFEQELRRLAAKEWPGKKTELIFNDKNRTYGFTVDGIPSNQFIQAPRLKKEATGVVEFRSRDYRFLDDVTQQWSYGSSIKKENLRPYGFAVPVLDGEIQYHLTDSD